MDYTKYPVTYKKRGHRTNDIFYKKTHMDKNSQKEGASPLPPTSASLQNKIPYIFDQGTMNSCVSNATALAISYFNNNFIPSRLFIYYNGRAICGTPLNQDSEMDVVDGCMSVQQFPPCQETLWPYLAQNLPIKPSQNAYSNPITLNNFTYLAVNQDINDIKNCINDGNPIIFGITLYQSFYDSKTAKTGVVPMPNPSIENQKGGHCILMVGYDDNSQTVTCANSWGTQWGNHGFFTLPYQYVLDPNYSCDFYTLNFTNTDINVATSTSTSTSPPNCNCIIV
jgi:C1A family cysteine protease